MAVRAADRRRLRQIYAFACGYCRISEADNGSELTVDHFQPVSHGGTDDISNLVYACHACNQFKGDHWNPDGEQRILHPLNDRLEEHIVDADTGILGGLTPTGAFHITALNLNRFPACPVSPTPTHFSGYCHDKYPIEFRGGRPEDSVERNSYAH